MDMIARAVAFVIMAMAAKVQKIELVDEAVIFQQVHRAIDRYARDIRVNFLSAFEDFLGVHMARRAFEHFDKHHALPRETNAALPDFSCEMAGRLVLVDAFANGRTVRKGHWRWGITHLAIIADSF